MNINGNAIQTVNNRNNQIMAQPADEYTQLAQKYLATCGQNVPQNKVVEFMEIAKAKKLNPFNREIYLVGYKDKFNIITGYEVYLTRAEKNPVYDGFEFSIDNSNPKDISGTITIYRKDRNHPFKHTVYMNEVIGKKYDGTVNSMWLKMPRFMLKKVAIGQGFRLCFPVEFGGMPYVADELPEEEETKERNVTPTAEPVMEPAPAVEAPKAEENVILFKHNLRASKENGDKINELLKNPVLTDEDKKMMFSQIQNFTPEEFITAIEAFIADKTKPLPAEEKPNQVVNPAQEAFTADEEKAMDQAFNAYNGDIF